MLCGCARPSSAAREAILFFCSCEDAVIFWFKCTGDDATIFCGAVLDFKNLGLKLLLFTRQQSFVDKLDENSKFFLVILHDFQNNAVNTLFSGQG